MSDHASFIHERVALARSGDDPTVIARVTSGWAVLADHQFIPGYSLLLPDPVVDDITDLDEQARAAFLLDMTYVGDALLAVTDAWRINYEILGNTTPVLHAHVWPRYRSEPEERQPWPVWRYPDEAWHESRFSATDHGELLAALRRELTQR